MTSASHPHGGSDRPRVCRLVSALVTAVLGSTATAVGVGERAAAAETPWLTVSDGFASFAIPADYIQNTMGEPSLVVVEGNFGPSFNWSELGLTHFGDTWRAVIGPLPPGLYYYRITGDDTKTVKDPTNPTRVTSEAALSTFLIPGEPARLLVDVPAGQGGNVE